MSYVDLGGKEWVFGERATVKPEVVSGMFVICRESDVTERRIGRPAEEAGARASPGTWPQRLARGCDHNTNKKQAMLACNPNTWKTEAGGLPVGCQLEIIVIQHQSVLIPAPNPYWVS